MNPIQIGLCGLGVVGRGVLDILRTEQEFLRPRSGLDLRVRRVFDRSWRRKEAALRRRTIQTKFSTTRRSTLSSN